MRLLYICLLLLPVWGWSQEKPLEKIIKNARLLVKADKVPDLFTSNGSIPSIKNAQRLGQLIQNLTINTDVLNFIREQKRSFLEISLPMVEGKLDLELVPVNIFAPGFTVKTSRPELSPPFDIKRLLVYHGIVKGNPNSIATITISDSTIIGMVSDSTGSRVLARIQEKTTLPTGYAFYDEKAVTTQTQPFKCGTVDSHSLVSIPFKSGRVANETTQTKSSCVGYVGIYAEVDNALYQYYGSVDKAITQITFLFNQVAAIYQNEGIYIKLSQIYVWNTADPYNFHSNGANDTELMQYKNYWNAHGNSFQGQLAHLLTNGTTAFSAGGIAYLDGITDRNFAYGVTTLNESKNFAAYPTYSRVVKVVTHELGHNLGSHHTHWCGWSGGAIDNCAPTEVDNNNSCPPGLPPISGGTIMSYCPDGFNLQNGFGQQPGNAIRSRIASISASLPITTSDNGLLSVTSGSWTTGGTWICGLVPSVVYDVTISNQNAVQLGTNGEAKSLNITGTGMLNISNASLNIKNN